MKKATINSMKKQNIIHADICAGSGRELLTGTRFKHETPSLLAYLEDERTHQYINASFLPFFALLSIPPSFN